MSESKSQRTVMQQPQLVLPTKPAMLERSNRIFALIARLGDVVICNSPAKHLGGNEMTDFGKAAGADRGQI
ncbi:uncharacterized protein PAC_00888 [Phialocephala subalpina]|uniref:Uncharacterized protein n=1 Tax=Phialocephala subalpina TaxID=576137 RepID=A0A1L7WE00_9HELO|nr:uncharacterized protein PAC_00888 [Phialocephala subalpina]